MDFSSECSAAHESVDDNEFSANQELKFSESSNLLVVVGDDANKVEANGSESDEVHDTASSGPPAPANGFHQNSDGKEIERLGNSVTSPPLPAVSPPPPPPAVGLPPSTKGKGLRKWRRFKRDAVKDATVNAGDGTKILKRVFSGSGNQSAKPNNSMPVEIRQNDEGPVGSPNVLKDTAFSDGDVNHRSSLDSKFATGSGMYSENSQECSSKSSMAASAPRVASDLPTVLGHVREERNRIKNSSVKWVGTSSSPRVQQGKGWFESSKKPRGERVKIEKEHSHSSMESDSRSSNFVFVQGAYSATSNGKLGGRSLNYDGENSDKAHAVEQQFDVEVQTGSVQENDGEVEDFSHRDSAAGASWEDKEEKSNANHQPLLDQDPLVESIRSLQSVQEALESEVEKLGNVGKDNSVPADLAYTGPRLYESSPPNQYEYPRNLSSLESQVLNLTENVTYLESKLEEAKTLLEMKESRVTELEATLNAGDLTKGTLGNTIDLESEKSIEIETELEGLFKQKIEGEVMYVALTSTVENLRAAAGDQITLLREQVALAGEQARLVNKLGEERKAEILKKQAELEKCSEEILGTEDVLKMKGRVCKVGSCLFVQSMLLILVFWLLALQSAPRSGVIVPT